MKKIWSTIVCLIVLLSFALPSYALNSEINQDYNIFPLRYVNIASVSCTLTISGNTATAKGKVETYSSSASIYVRVTLQRNTSGSWQNVSDASWSKSVIGMSTSASGSKTISSGTYRVETYYIVTYNGITESGTVYSTTKTY